MFENVRFALKNTVRFETHRTSPKVLTAPNDVLADKFTVLFWSFYNNGKWRIYRQI